jgi:hypothetical protein
MCLYASCLGSRLGAPAGVFAHPRVVEAPLVS